jgi:DNA ligase-1
MTPSELVISSLETHNLRTNKEQIIRAEAEAGNKEFFEGVRMALSPYITFGIKQVPEKTDNDPLTSENGMNFESFALACTGFVSRQVTGNTARDMIHHMMLASTKAQWNGWYRRILIKDLRCGVSEKTINKVVENDYPDFAIPVFSCQLAHDSSNHESKVAGRKQIEVKLDGVRVITIVYTDGRVDQFSRNGKELVNFDVIKSQLAKLASQINEDMVFDGEVMSSSFQDLMKQVHRKSDVKADDAVLYLFDALPLKDFEKGKCAIPQDKRTNWLTDFYNANMNSLPNVSVLDVARIDLDTEQGQRLFSMYNKSAVENGYEGIMIKDPKAPYECKRTASWLKLKPFIEVSLEVKAVEEGTGRNVGRLGALVCEGVDMGKEIRVNVGSGFSDIDRDQFWGSGDSLLGQIVEIRADAITQNQDGSYSLRFPRFLRFRGFDVGEKL